jgi:hypothetical protein
MQRTWVVAAMALAAGSALAQNAAPKARTKGDFEKPLARAGGGGNGTSSMYFSQQDGGDRYELSVSGDGEMTAKVNGEEVPADRIKRGDGTIELLDKDGKTLTTFNIDMGRNGRFWTVGKGGRGWNQVAPEARAAWTPPKVMMGITMSEPSDAVRKFLDLKDGEAVLVDRVIEGLAADKAGIKPQDLIVEFDGAKVVTQSKIRDILKDKNEGDKIDAVVIRKGERKSVQLELQKYDSARLGEAVAIAGDDEVPEPNKWNNDNVRRLGRLQENWDPQAWERMQEEFNKAFNQGNGARVFGQNPDGTFRSFSMPMDQAKIEKLQAELSEKNAKLSEQLAKVNEQLAKLNAELQKMQERLDSGDKHKP